MSFQKLIKSKIFFIPDIKSIAQKTLNLLKRFLWSVKDSRFYFLLWRKHKGKKIRLYLFTQLNAFVCFLEVRSHSVVQASLEDTLYLFLASDLWQSSYLVLICTGIAGTSHHTQLPPNFENEKCILLMWYNFKFLWMIKNKCSWDWGDDLVSRVPTTQA